MTLKLYNTRTRRKEDFQPLDPNNVRIYVCGPTVYDYAHIGNARPVIVFDVLYRLLRHLYGESHVTYVRNITDVDDKINARAAERYPDLPFNDAIRKLTGETTAQFHKDVAALGCLPPTHEPRATEYIAQMREMIETLVDKGFAYVAEDHALFNVSAMPDYGQLARRSLDEMRAGARIEVAPYKRDPMDFVLWKPSKEGEPSWPSPRGITAPGRPGWHLECSAMAKALLGETFDIHGGGIDLVFPHHENEVAQSRCAHGTDIMANVWMHNGHLQVEGAKMSKSDGNFVTIRNLTHSQMFGGRYWHGDVVRLAMIKTHYRQPIDWTISLLDEAETNLSQFEDIHERFDPTSISTDFVDALRDDLNTKSALDILTNLAREANRGDYDAGGQLVASLNLLGFLQPFVRLGPPFERDARGNTIFDEDQFYKEMETFLPDNARLYIVRRELIDKPGVFSLEIRKNLANLTRYADGRTPTGFIWQNKEKIESINALIDTRHKARHEKNWTEADRIRDELAAQGIALKDAKDPATGEIVTTWEIAR